MRQQPSKKVTAQPAGQLARRSAKRTPAAIVKQPVSQLPDGAPIGYKAFLADVKVRIRTAQIRAALAVNSELTVLYWSIGRDILLRQKRDGWGARIIDRLAMDLAAAFPGVEGFSRTNIYRMRAFYQAWPPLSGDASFVPQPVGQSSPKPPAAIVPQPVGQLAGGIPADISAIPWGHNIVLIERLKTAEERLWYARQTIENGWSRSMLEHWIDSGLYARQGKSVNNFKATLPAPQSDLAQQLIKDPFNFDFLTLAADAGERELEQGLLVHIRKFLLELGVGFAFVGQQVRLECSIGLILCKTRKKTVAEYALRDLAKPVGVARYVTRLVESLPKQFAGSLPSVKQIEAELATDTAGSKPNPPRKMRPPSGKRGKR